MFLAFTDFLTIQLAIYQICVINLYAIQPGFFIDRKFG